MSEKKGKARKEGGWTCTICAETFETRRKLQAHRKEAHDGTVQVHRCECFCKFCGRKSISKEGNTKHERSCLNNPNRVDGCTKGYKMTDEQRKRCSEARKRVIAENGGVWWSSRSKCKRSYAEEWTLKMLHNEVQDQNFQEEFHLGKWFMDFAWPSKKLCLEIDGEQHEWPERKAKDAEKDTFYKSLGWKVLRLSWKYITNNTQEAILSIKNFVDNAPVV